MRLELRPFLPTQQDQLLIRLTDLHARSAKQVNDLTEGFVSAVTNAAAAAPTTGTYAQGDYVRKAAPVEAGAATAKYVIVGWVCVAGGTPGTWVEARFLTGN